MAKVAPKAPIQTPPKAWLLAFALSLLPVAVTMPSLFWLLCNGLAVLGVFMLLGLLRHRGTFNSADKALQVLPRFMLFIWLPILLALIDSPIILSKQIWIYPLCGVMGLAVLVLLRVTPAVKPLAILLSWFVCISLFNGLAQLGLDVDMLNRPFIDEEATSFFANNSDYSFYMGMLCVVPLYTLHLLGANRLSHLLMTMYIISAMLITTEVSAWIMLFWGLLPYLYLVYIKPSNRPIVPIVVVPLWLVALFAIVQHLSSDMQQSLMFGEYYQLIVEMWRLSTELLSQHWLNGVGVGNFEAAFRPFMALNAQAPMGIDITHPHQLLLEVGVSTGILGLLGLLLACAAIWRLWKQALPLQKKLALPVLMPVVVMWWPFNEHHSFYSPELVAITVFFLALSIATLTQHSDHQ